MARNALKLFMVPSNENSEGNDLSFIKKQCANNVRLKF